MLIFDNCGMTFRSKTNKSSMTMVFLNQTLLSQSIKAILIGDYKGDYSATWRVYL